MTVLCVLSRFRDDYHPSLCLLFVLIHTSFLDIYTDWSQTYCSARSLIPHPLPFPLCMSLLLLLLFDTMKKKNRHLHLSHTAHEFHVRSMCFLYTSGFGEAV
jgi:hypothetical protein